jgi:hypothetical protein
MPVLPGKPMRSHPSFVFIPNRNGRSVVYDTSVTMVRSAPAANPEAAGSAPPMIAVASPKLREALAELPPQPANPKTLHHKFARKPPAKPVWLAARRAPLGWLGPTIW